MQLINQVKDAIKFINDMNVSMTNIGMITGLSQEKIQGMTKDYSNLATQLHETTSSIMQASEEFLRAGHTHEETLELIKASTIMSKISGEDQKATADQLIAITNAYKLNISDVMGVVDKLTTVDNMSATSTRELGTAIERTASSAQLAGVTFDNLVSYIATVSSVSRKSASSIGESFKTIFARFQDVKLGKNFDEENQDISTLETTLKRVAKIDIRSSSGQFKSFDTVIQDLSKSWATLSQVEQSEAAKVFAGVRQRDNFLILMNNMTTATKLQASQLDSAGSAEKRYGVFSESTQATINDLTNAFQKLYTTLLDSKAFNSALDLLIKTVVIADDLAKGIGDLISQFSHMSDMSKDMSDTGKTVNEMFGIQLKTSKQLNAELEKSNKNAKEQSSSQDTQIVLAKTLTGNLDELSKATNKTKEQKTEMFNITDKLNKLIPDLNLSVNTETGALNTQTSAIYDTIDAYKDLLLVKASEKQASDAATTLLDAQTKIETLKAKKAEIEAIPQTNIAGGQAAIVGDNGLKAINDELKATEDIAKSASDFIDGVAKRSAAFYTKHPDKVTAPKKPEPDFNAEDNKSTSTTGGVTINEETFKLEKDRYMGPNEALNDVNNALEKNKSAQESTSDLKEKNRLIEEENGLLVQKRKAINDITYEQGQEASEKRKQLEDYAKTSGFAYLFDEKGNINAKEYDALIEKKASDIEDLKGKGKSEERAQQIQELNNVKQIASTYIDLYGTKIPAGLREMETLSGQVGKNLLTEKDNKIDISFEKVNPKIEAFKDEITSLAEKEKLLDKDDFMGKKSIRVEELNESLRATRTLEQELSRVDKQSLEDGTSNSEKFITARKKITDAIEENKKKTEELKVSLKDLAKETVQADIDTRKAALDLQEQIYAEQDKQKERQLQDKENANQDTIDALEKQLFGGKQDAYETQVTNRNDALQKQLDTMTKQEDSLSKQQELSQKLLDLEKAKLELANTQNERNSRLYTGKGFEWVANPNAVKTAQDKVTSLQQDYDKLQQTQANDASKQNLQDQIQSNKDMLDNKNKAFEATKKILEDSVAEERKAWERSKQQRDRKVEDEKTSLELENKNIDNAMKDLAKKYNNNWQAIIDDYSGKVKAAEALKQQMMAALTTQVSSTIASSGVSGTTGATTTKPIVPIGTQVYNGVNIGTYQGVDSSGNDARLALMGMDTGGYTGNEDGVAMLHKKELILDADDTKNILNAVYASRTMEGHPAGSISNNSSNTTQNQTVYNLNNVKIVSDNAEQLWKNIEGYAVKRRQ